MFEGLLCSPDAVNQVAFKLFDVGNSGTVTFGKRAVPRPVRTLLYMCIVCKACTDLIVRGRI